MILILVSLTEPFPNRAYALANRYNYRTELDWNLSARCLLTRIEVAFRSVDIRRDLLGVGVGLLIGFRVPVKASPTK